MEAESRRAKAGLAAVVAGCVALMSVVVLTGSGSAASGLKFTQSGHWVYNSAIGRILHLDGATRDIDAEIPLPTGAPGAQVVQSDKHGYVLSRSRIQQFGKSDLAVADPIEVPVDEQPVGLESAGAAFAVYQKAGRIMRFGDREAAEFPGGPLGDPVVTSDGTLWVHRVNQGDLCQLPLAADRMSCPASIPRGHKGALSAIGTKSVFVDLTARQVYALTGEGIGDRSSLGDVDVPDNALVAANDVGGKLAIVDAGQSVLHLVDPSGDGGKAVSTPIRRGRYDKVASSGDGLALLDRKSAALVTLDRNGRETSHQRITSQEKADEQKREPNLFRGDDSRVYVESGKGDRVVVVDRDGSAATVQVKPGEPGTAKTTTKPSAPPTTTSPKVAPSTVKPSVGPSRNSPPPVRPGNEKTNRPPSPATSKPTNQATAKAGLPGAPSAVQARLVNGAATVTWRPAAPHGAPITSYRLSWSGGSMTVSGSARSAKITNLAAQTGYYVTIRAVNRVGAGPAVRSNRVEFSWAAADSPTGLVVRSSSNGTVVLGWNRPELHEGTFVRYDVKLGSTTRPATTEQVSWSGLTNGKRYTFTVRAITRAPDGRTLTGAAATLSATPQRAERVIASRGAGAEYDNCKPPSCAFIHVQMENLRPNTRYVIKPYTEKWGNFNPGAALTTDAQGNQTIDDRFPCNAVGQKVWVTVEGPEGTYTSNKFVWPSS